MKQLIHRISVINSQGIVYELTNIGDNKNKFIGVDSVVINKSKDDLIAEAKVNLSSKFDLIGVKKFNQTEFILNNQLPLNSTENNLDSFDRYDVFSFKNEDLILIELAYNENTEDNKEFFFGIIKNAEILDKNVITINVVNILYFFKKIIYNYSKDKIEIKSLIENLINDFNNKIKIYYENHINNIKNEDFKKLIKNCLEIKFNKYLINVDFTIQNFRAQNSTALDILSFISDNYYSKSNLIQLNKNGDCYFIFGLFNLFQSSDLKKGGSNLETFFDKDYVFKNYNLQYENFGLNNTFIKKEIDKINTINLPEFFNLKSSSLIWQNSSDINVKVNIKVINRNNEVVEKNYGDENGETVEVVFYEDKSENQLKNIATEIIKDSKYTGYKKGSTINTYGDCSIDLWQNFYLIDVFQNQDKNDNQYNLIVQRYFVNSILVNYSTSGFEKIVEFGLLLNTNVRNTTNPKLIQLKGEGDFVTTETNN